MTPEKTIEELFKRHKLWLGFARQYITKSNMMQAEDVVQTAYIKILVLLRNNKGKTINDTYFFNTIKYICFDDAKRAWDPLKHAWSGTGDLRSGDIQNLEDEREPTREDLDVIMKSIDDYVETFYHFDKLLFNAYRYEFRSIRKLSQATKIGHVQVFETVKRCKEKINDKLKFKYYGKE